MPGIYMIEIRTIQHALAVAKFRNFSKAAESVYITQPALTRSIKALEEALGVKLFYRDKKSVSPTLIGHTFLARAEEVMKAASELKREIDLARGLKIGHLRIGSGVWSADLLMGKAIGRLSQRYPHLYIDITLTDFKVLINLLRSAQIELFVGESSEVEGASDFLVTPLTVLKAYLFCRQAHPLLDRLPNLTLRECLEYPFAITILPRRMIDSIAETLGIKKYSNDLSELPLIKVDSEPIIKATVASSDAIGMGLLPMIERELKSGEFVILPCDFPELKRHNGIVQLTGHNLSPFAEHFIAILKEVDAEVARTDQGLRQAMRSRLVPCH